MIQLDGWALTGSISHFREGISAFRNARDWTHEQRDELIAAANERLTNATGISRDTSALGPSQRVSQSTVEPASLDNETSAHELSQDYVRASNLLNKCLKREPEKRPSIPNLKARVEKNLSGTNSRSRSRGRPSQRR